MIILMEVFSDLAEYDRQDTSEELMDLDFSDIFGGPPRRFSMQEARVKYAFGETVGSDEDGGSSLWGPMEEKVVFREERVRGRRRQSDDFYDDIFRGDESYDSLRRADLDRDNLFSLKPDSRILSLDRVLSPEPFGTFLLAQSRFSNQAIGEQEKTKHDVQPAYPQSPLSHESSFSLEDSQYNVQNLKKDTESHVDSNGSKFHFSIYKWAGRGVPMTMPLVNRNSFRSKDDRRRFEFTNSNGTTKDSRSEVGIEQLDRYCVEETVFGVLDSKSHHDVEENVAFEVNSLPELLTDEVEQLENTTTIEENETFTPKEGTAKNMIQDNHVDEAQESTQKATYSSGSCLWNSRTSVENSDDPFEDNFVVQELSDDLEKVTQSGEATEDMKDLDAKIGQWSSGKKGNIRSLLSTLQYVLWAGSGWKPIALVDLIEANSVKRAYQKAMLQLHPDKLQQKGAPSHHKYIAQKVFNILQDAWDHFTTLAPL